MSNNYDYKWAQQIVAVDQAKRKVIGFIWRALLTIADTKVPVDFIVIDTPRVVLLVETDWLRRYLADLLFSKKRLVLESSGQKLSTLIEYDQTIRSPNHKLEKYEVNTTEWEYDGKALEKYGTQRTNAGCIISVI